MPFSCFCLPHRLPAVTHTHHHLYPQRTYSLLRLLLFPLLHTICSDGTVPLPFPIPGRFEHLPPHNRLSGPSPFGRWTACLPRCYPTPASAFAITPLRHPPCLCCWTVARFRLIRCSLERTPDIIARSRRSPFPASITFRFVGSQFHPRLTRHQLLTLPILAPLSYFNIVLRLLTLLLLICIPVEGHSLPVSACLLIWYHLITPRFPLIFFCCCSSCCIILDVASVLLMDDHSLRF